MVEPRSLDFDIGFWHPFGPHAGESAQQILARKQREIDTNGWTLWSFQNRSKSFPLWTKHLAAPQRVITWCSDSKGTKDPASAKAFCTSYRPAGAEEWLPIPAPIKVPHPLGERSQASAFIVEAILPLKGTPPPSRIEWLGTQDSAWHDGPVPTRGEYLVRPGGAMPMRATTAALVLKAPYLASVAGNSPDGPGPGT